MFLEAIRAMRKAQRRALKLGKRIHIHQMLGMLIVVAHASEIGRVVSHITIYHLLVALALFAVWLVTQNNVTEDLA